MFLLADRQRHLITTVGDAKANPVPKPTCEFEGRCFFGLVAGLVLVTPFWVGVALLVARLW